MIKFGFGRPKKTEDEIPFPLVILSKETSIITLNKAAREYLGYSKGQQGYIAYGYIDEQPSLINTTYNRLNTSAEFTVHKTTGNSFTSVLTKKALFTAFEDSLILSCECKELHGYKCLILSIPISTKPEQEVDTAQVIDSVPLPSTGNMASEVNITYTDSATDSVHISDMDISLIEANLGRDLSDMNNDTQEENAQVETF